jgi:hypothetical protein
MEAKFVILLALAAVVAILLLRPPQTQVPDYQIEGAFGADVVQGGAQSISTVRHRFARVPVNTGWFKTAGKQAAKAMTRAQATQAEQAAAEVTGQATEAVLARAAAAAVTGQEVAVEVTEQAAAEAINFGVAVWSNSAAASSGAAGMSPLAVDVVQQVTAGISAARYSAVGATALTGIARFMFINVVFQILINGAVLLYDFEKWWVNQWDLGTVLKGILKGTYMEHKALTALKLSSSSHYQSLEWFQKLVGTVMGIKNKNDVTNISLAMYHLASNVRPVTILVPYADAKPTDIKNRPIEIEKGVFIKEDYSRPGDVIPAGAKLANYKREHWVLFGYLEPTAVVPMTSLNDIPSKVEMLTAEQMAPDFKVISDAVNNNILSSDNVKLFGSLAVAQFNHGKELKLTNDMVKYYDEIETINEIEQKLQAAEKSVDEKGFHPKNGCKWTKIEEFKEACKQARTLLAKKRTGLQKPTTQPRRNFTTVDTPNQATTRRRLNKDIDCKKFRISRRPSFFDGFLQAQDKDNKWLNVSFWVGDSQVQVKSVQKELECASDSSSLYLTWALGSPCDNTVNNRTPGKYVKTSAGNCELPFKGLMTFDTLVKNLTKKIVETNESFCTRFVRQIIAIRQSWTKHKHKAQGLHFHTQIYSTKLPVSMEGQISLFESINTFAPAGGYNIDRNIYINPKDGKLYVAWSDIFEKDCDRVADISVIKTFPDLSQSMG